MPVVNIIYNPAKGIEKEASKIADVLPAIIAKTLSIPGHPRADLTEEDTEVRIARCSGLDINPPGLAIEIRANEYEGRKANLDERTAEIVELIKESEAWSENLNGNAYVWVMLMPASFIAF